MKGVFVVIDGVADEPCPLFEGKTPLEAAHTPFLDWFASRSSINYCHTVREGVAPESTAILCLLGQDYSAVARGSLEALGAGIKLTRGDVAFRCNFATIDDLSSRNLLDRRAGRTLSTSEAQTLAQAVRSKVKLPCSFDFVPTIQHRAVLVLRGGYSANISNTDSSFNAGPPKLLFSEALDDDENSRLTAEILNSFTRHSFEVLDAHPLNKKRAAKGLYAANCIICRDAGDDPARLPKLKGKWRSLAYMPLEKGIARALKMDVSSFDYPPLKDIDVYSNLYVALDKGLKEAAHMIAKYHQDYDYFFVHFKETDLPGHDNKPRDKKNMIERIDSQFFGFLQKFFEKHPAKLLVTADHTTSCRAKAHTSHPVPLLYYFPNLVEPGPQRFTESFAARGKRFLGKNVLSRTFFS